MKCLLEKREWTKSHICFFLPSDRESDQEPDQLLPVFLKSRINQLLLQVFGEIGGHTTVDVLKFDATTKRAILRCPDADYVKVRSALALVPTFQDVPCCLKVHCASPVLLSLLTTHQRWYAKQRYGHFLATELHRVRQGQGAVCHQGGSWAAQSRGAASRWTGSRSDLGVGWDQLELSVSWGYGDWTLRSGVPRCVHVFPLQVRFIGSDEIQNVLIIVPSSYK